MTQLSKRINSFAELGNILSSLNNKEQNSEYSKFHDLLNEAIRKTCYENPWFFEDSYNYGIKNIAKWLNKEQLSKWLNPYQIEETNKKTVAVIMAGNIPLVGFHDFLCILITGNTILTKLSHNDKYVLPAIAKIITELNNDFENKILFAEEKLENFEAIIATGSNNSAQYFEYYFKKYPNIIRKSRNSVAVLTGKETENELILLGSDLFDFFGMGCRNVSKIYIPQNYKIETFFDLLTPWKHLIDNNKYYNNYTYHKAIFLLNSDVFFDLEYALFIESASFSSPVAVYNFERYETLEKVQSNLTTNAEAIQCVVGLENQLFKTVPFGKSQAPELWDYADNVDTVKFILSVNSTN
ncbi:MAG: acyl-CoA reductase [Bacteroidota bacterium]